MSIAFRMVGVKRPKCKTVYVRDECQNRKWGDASQNRIKATTTGINYSVLDIDLRLLIVFGMTKTHHNPLNVYGRLG
jgi:hypothetical protein